MSYSIYIGNAEVYAEWDPGYGESPRAEWQVNRVELPEAPFTADNTGRSNNRDPGYGQWAEFCRQTGLHRLFFDKEDGLMREHPGCQRLERTHLDFIVDAHRTYSGRNPNRRPGACECSECQWSSKSTDIPHDPSLDFNMCRLAWLEFWVRWALENCERPAIYNR